MYTPNRTPAWAGTAVNVTAPIANAAPNIIFFMLLIFILLMTSPFQRPQLVWARSALLSSGFLSSSWELAVIRLHEQQLPPKVAAPNPK